MPEFKICHFAFFQAENWPKDGSKIPSEACHKPGISKLTPTLTGGSCEDHRILLESVFDVSYWYQNFWKIIALKNYKTYNNDIKYENRSFFFKYDIQKIKFAETFCYNKWN